ncbi:MAG: hypothetical protein NZ928_04960 [Endomicrobia bacterium]|nr:hypothetical protein [Endomicrobiia bacterium]
MKIDNINKHLNEIKAKQTHKLTEGILSGSEIILHDRNFIRFLKENYPSVYDFFMNCEHSNELVPTAAVSINPKTGIPVLYLNPQLVSYFLEFSHKETGYHFLAKILLHEMLHIVLKHFRYSFKTELENKLYNITADVIIDNLITIYTDDDKAPWRNWEEFFSTNDIKTLNGEKFSVIYNHSNYVLNFSDIYIFHRMLELPYEQKQKIIENTQLIDEHRWSSYGELNNLNQKGKKVSEPETDSGQQKQYREKTEGKDEEQQKSSSAISNASDVFIDNLLNKCRERQNKLDKMLTIIQENKYFDWKNRLRRYIPMISSSVVSYTWKKVNRRLPELVPGVKRKLKPGSVLIVFDVSASMHNYYERGTIAEVINTIYVTFMEIAKVNLLSETQGKLYEAEVDDKMIGNFRKYESIHNFKEKVKFTRGGGTNYKDVFDRILAEWPKIEPGKRIPDLTIFITDLGVNLNFLEEYKYKIFRGRLIWLYFAGSVYKEDIGRDIRVPLGEVIEIYSN